MPTENRSSNTDPRDVFIRLNPLGLGEQALRKDSTGFEDQRTHSDYLLFLAGYRETHPEPQPHADPGEVERLRYKAELYDEVWELATGLGYMNVTTAISKLRSQLAECEAMAAMVAEREWAEHVGTGDGSSKVEAAFTQLHNDLHEASEKLAERDALLRELADAPPAAMEFRLQQKVKAALSASA